MTQFSQPQDSDLALESEESPSPSDASGNPNSQATAALYNEQLHCLPIIKLLNRVIKSVQKHRGTSIACLGGDVGFEQVTDQLQNQIDKQLLLISNFAQSSPKILTIKQLFAIQQNWHTIKVGWRDDTIIENFEFHGHLLDQLQGLIRNLCFHHFPQMNGGSSTKQDETEVSNFLLEAVLRDIPDNIELLARLRGLATHATSTKTCDEQMRVRLGFAIKQSREQYRRLATRLRQFNLDTDPWLIQGANSVNQVDPHQVKLDDLLSIIEIEVINSKRVIAKTDTIFNRATEIIDLLWLVSEQGISAIERQIYQEIDHWTESSI